MQQLTWGAVVALAVATLGGLLSVAFAPVASAESALLDVTLASPSTVELPTTIVLSSSQPDVEVGTCYSGGPDPEHPTWGPPPGASFQLCYPYLVGRGGPDASGRYSSEWRLPLFQPGEVTFGVGASGVGNAVTFTVTGNQSTYGDFRSCTYTRSNSPVAQEIVGYYAQVETSLTYQLQQRKRTKSGKRRWITVKRYEPQTFPIAHSELESGYGPYERRLVSQHILEKVLFPRRPNRGLYPLDPKAPQSRMVYVVSKGKRPLRRGVVSKKACQEHVHAPFVTP